jgi:small subunit ribosomal protein S20
MPKTKSAERRARSSERKHVHNKAILSRLKTVEKRFLTLVGEAKKDAAALALRALTSALDKAAKSDTIHANTASRKKSRLAARLAAMK